MTDTKKRCFVVQGFGEKVDFRTSRTLNLDDSYAIIKEAVEAAGLECVRADEIMHSGSIDVEMWEAILDADLVIADVSTSNWNAAYELGVRHALRPFTTIVVAEKQFEFAFDINHIAITTYEHLGAEIGRHEAVRFKEALQALIEQVMEAKADPESASPDSPVYLSVQGLRPPERAADAASEAFLGAVDTLSSADAKVAEEIPGETSQAWGPLRDQALDAKQREDWATARTLLEAAHKIVPKEEYITQQLALATYKSKQPTKKDAFLAAHEILLKLGPKQTADPETLGLWSAVHKGLWFETGDPAHLNEAIRANEKGLHLAADYYNGINLAFLLNVRGSLPDADPAEAIADFVSAARARRRVIEIGTEVLENWQDAKPGDSDFKKQRKAEDKYWVLASLQEAAVGLADTPAAEEWEAKATAAATQDWMLGTTGEQIAKLRKLLQASPLDLIGIRAETTPGRATSEQDKKPKSAEAGAGKKNKKKKKKK